MSLFGKILAILNVLAAIGFFFMAMMGYAKRQAWAEMALHRQVQLEGLPVDEKEPNLDGSPRVDAFRDAFLTKLFQDSGGNPSKTQVQEVEKLKAKLLSQLDEQPAEGKPQLTKAQKLARILLPLAVTSSERRALLQRMADAKNDKTDDLEARFEAAFQSAVSPTGPNGARDPAARKESIARLLCRLTEVLNDGQQQPNQDPVTTPAYKRVVTTVGLAACAQAFTDYAFDLEQVSNDVRAEMDSARYAFADLSRQKLESIEDWSLKCERQKAILKAEQEKVTQQEELVAARKVELAKALKDLNAKQETTAAMLKEQATMEQQLFKNRNIAHDAFEENQKLEREIRALERAAAASQR